MLVDIPSWRKKQIEGKDSYMMEFDLPIIDYKRLLSDFVNQGKRYNCTIECTAITFIENDVLRTFGLSLIQ